jgi:hypothetical protein
MFFTLFANKTGPRRARRHSELRPEQRLTRMSGDAHEHRVLAYARQRAARPGVPERRARATSIQRKSTEMDGSP